MIYQIEQIQTKKGKRLVIVYVVTLLLVLLVAIGLGIYAAKKVNEKKNENIDSSQIVEKTKKDQQQDINVTTQEKKKSNFVEQVNNIYNATEGKRVFLTFDDGPSNTVTPHILDILKKYNIKATFFVLGNRVTDYADLIKREYNEGHYIANHGYSHRYSKIYASSNDVIKEYNKTEEAIKKALENPNYTSNLFRFPGGSVGGEYDDIKTKARKELQENKIAYLDWNALTNDAAGAETKEEIMQNLKKTVGSKDNVVILMHDAPDKILTYETLEDVIQYLQGKGYAFKNMYDLIDAEE